MHHNAARRLTWGCLCVLGMARAAAAWDGSAIAVTNYMAGETVRYPLVRLCGTLTDETCRSVTVVNESSRTDSRRMEGLALKGRFKALAELRPGKNRLILSAGDRKTRFVLNYKPQTNPYQVRAIHFTDKSGDPTYDTPFKDDPQDYRAKWDAALKTIQMFTAEEMNRQGYGRRTFNLELDKDGKVVVHIVKGKGTFAEMQKVLGGGAFDAAEAAVAEQLPPGPYKNLVCVAFSRHIKGTGSATAYAALGGGGVALMGGACFYSWPTGVTNIQKTFMSDVQIAETEFHADDVGRYALWATAATTIGCGLHELGHTFDLPHTRYHRNCIMVRGADCLNRYFTFFDPPCRQSKEYTEFKEGVEPAWSSEYVQGKTSAQTRFIGAQPYWSDVSAAALAPNRWFVLDDRRYRTNNTLAIALDPAKEDLVIRSDDGLAFASVELPGLADEFDRRAGLIALPRELRRPLADIVGSYGTTQLTVRVVDGIGNYGEANLEQLLAKEPALQAKLAASSAKSGKRSERMNSEGNPVASQAGLENIPLYLLTYDHAVGYPKIQEEARKTMAMLDQHPEWKTGGQIEGWTWDWLAKNDPGFVAEARKWIKKYAGRWEPAGGSYGQPYFTFISEESGIRQMLYGTRAIKEHLGYDNDIYIYSEHETMPQLPQILAGMGYRGAFFRTHMQYGGDGPARDADWVLWTGPDGSSIPAIPSYSGLEQCWGNMWLMTGYEPGWGRWSHLEAFKAEMRSRGVQHPLISRCDDWGTRPNPGLMQDAKAHARNTKWVTAPEYFDIIERSGIKPVSFQAGPNDFIPEQPWGYCGNRTWTGPRVAASQALAAETLAATAILNGFKWTPAHQQRLDDAWKNLLIGEHHDSMIVAIYNEARDFTDPSQELSQGLAKETAEFIAARTQVKGDAVFVFNPTGHARSEAVFLSGTSPVRLIAPDGTAIAAEVGPTGSCFVARDVPSLGYKVYRIEPGQPAAAAANPGDARSFETGRYQVGFGAEGGLVKLRDKLTGRNLIKEGAKTGFLEGMIGQKMEQSRGNVQFALTGPDVWRVVESGMVGVVPYEMAYTFAGDNTRIDLDIRLEVPAGTRIGCPDKKVEGAPARGGQWDHGAKLRYIFNAELEETMDKEPRAVRHQPLIIQTAAAGDQTLDANLWASVETEKTGLAISNCGSMGYRAVGSTLEPILAYSGEYVWGNQKFMEGTYTYRYSLVPYAGYSLHSYAMHRGYGGPAGRGAAHRQAVERDRPLYVLEFKGQGGKLPLQGSAMELPKIEDAVSVQALFPQDGRLFLRLCNMSEKPVSVPLDRPVKAVNLALTERTPAPSPLLLHPWRAQTYEIADKR